MRNVLIAVSLSVVTLLANAEPVDWAKRLQFPVERYQLANGMTVLLLPDPSVPTLSFHTWIKVGSKNEQQGLTGLAHLFEHLSFRGTPRLSGVDYEEILHANGIVNNAATSRDTTDHMLLAPSSKLEMVLDLESDRLANLKIDQTILDTEREVVKEELRTTVDNSPMGALIEAIFGSVFKKHPYRWPIGGTLKDLDAVKLSDAQDFHKTYYAPNNATLVLSGDFEVRTAKRLIEKYYGKIPAQTLPKQEIAPEPEQTAQRGVELKRSFKNALWSVSFRTPKADDADTYALELIARILGSGTSSRLHKALVYKTQLAGAAESALISLQDAGVLVILVGLKADSSDDEMNKAQEIVFSQLWRLRKSLVDDQELSKAKNQVLYDSVNSLKTADGRAEGIGINEVVLGDYRLLSADLAKYNAVTKEQIREVAERIFVPQHRNIVRLKPVAAKPGNKKSGEG